MGKRALKTEEEVKAEVDGLLGEFGVLGDADPSFDEESDAPKKLKNGERAAPLPPSAEADALWGGGSKKK
jgi:hypothetical protein